MWEAAVDTRVSIFFACRYLPATCGAELREKQQILIIALSFSKLLAAKDLFQEVALHI
jgi:hypothetical protein